METTSAWWTSRSFRATRPSTASRSPGACDRAPGGLSARVGPAAIELKRRSATHTARLSIHLARSSLMVPMITWTQVLQGRPPRGPGDVQHPDRYLFGGDRAEVPPRL